MGHGERGGGRGGREEGEKLSRSEREREKSFFLLLLRFSLSVAEREAITKNEFVRSGEAKENNRSLLLSVLSLFHETAGVSSCLTRAMVRANGGKDRNAPPPSAEERGKRTRKKTKGKTPIAITMRSFPRSFRVFSRFIDSNFTTSTCLRPHSIDTHQNLDEPREKSSWKTRKKNSKKTTTSGHHPAPAPGLRGGLPFARPRVGSFGADRGRGVLCVSVCLESRGEDTKNKKRKEERSIENFLLASFDRSIDLNLDLLDLFKQIKLKKIPVTSSPSRARRAPLPSSSSWEAPRLWGSAWASSSCCSGQGFISE